MKKNQRIAFAASVVSVVLLLSNLSFASSAEYDAMKENNSVKVIFDMRDAIPEFAAVHMKLIHDTYTQLKAMGKEPDFVVVFMGGSVKLISSDRSGFKTEDQKYLKEIADTISKMSRDGIRLEVCIAAVEIFKVDASSIPSEIKQVGNGWISEIGYQAKGYSLVPVY